MQRRLLAVLLIHAGRSVSADRLIDCLWAGSPPATAPSGLHTYVSRLRRLLGDGASLVSDARGYCLHVADQDLDSRRFEASVAAARQRSPDAPAETAAGLSEALTLWRGAAYAEFADEDFARAEAVRLEDLRLDATEDAFAARLEAGETSIVPDLEAFTTTHPLRERPHAQLMTALGQAGRPGDALEVFQRLRSRLTDELGLEPSPVLQQLQTDLLRQTPNVTSRPTVIGSTDRSPGPTPAGDLPPSVTSFVGRGHETEAVQRLLGRGRLVTLTGVGGVGKTRLALQAAQEVSRDHPDGAWWCELAPADPDAVGHAIAAVLGIQQQRERSITDSILGSLAGKRLLLVLDNCEHVVQACADLAGRILRWCPDVTLLATSREPLAVAGEQVWLVPPLPLPPDPSSDGPVVAPSVELFTDRARSHRSDFVLDERTGPAVADICRRLDGLPLAIELAAALVPALEPEEIARRLVHRFRLLTHGRRADPRHRSLVAVVGWSYHLLDDDEQRLFRRLAVFAGGFTLDAAEGVCSDGSLPADRVAGLLTRLVSRSMVEADHAANPTRFRLLETLRQYGAERLDEDGDEGGVGAALRARHASWFVDLAERVDAQVRGPDEVDAIHHLEVELANLRAAHRWGAEHEGELALRLSAALHVFALWRLRDEVFAWAEDAAELPSSDGHPLQPTVRGSAARGMSNRGELARTVELARRALHEAAATPRPNRFAALDTLSAAALYEGRLDDCRRLSQDALRSAEEAGDPYYQLMAGLHDCLALVYGQHREAGLAAALAQRAAADELGNPSMRGWSLYAHAEACGDDDPATALPLLEQALGLAAPARNRLLQGVTLVAIAALRARHSQPRDALEAFTAAIEHWRRSGDWTHQWTTLRNLIPLLVDLGADEPALLLFGAQRSADAAPAYGAEATLLQAAYTSLSSRVPDRDLSTGTDQGSRLTGDEAVELALTTLGDLLGTSIPNLRAASTGPVT